LDQASSRKNHGAARRLREGFALAKLARAEGSVTDAANEGGGQHRSRHPDERASYLSPEQGQGLLTFTGRSNEAIEQSERLRLTAPKRGTQSFS